MLRYQSYPDMEMSNMPGNGGIPYAQPYYGQPYANGAPPSYGQVVGAPMYQNSGMSAGTAGMLGVGAGMLGGMMIGNAMASHDHYGHHGIQPNMNAQPPAEVNGDAGFDAGGDIGGDF